MLRNNADDLDVATEVADMCLLHGLNELAAKTYRTVLNAAPDRHVLMKKLERPCSGREVPVRR